jgi:hypothetical protein
MSPDPPADSPEPKKPPGPTLTQTLLEHPTEVTQLLRAVEEAVDHFTANREKHYRAVANAQARTAAHIIWATLAIVGAAVTATGYLAYRGVVSGDAFTFVVGTVVGSLIAFMAEHVAPNLVTMEEADV